MKKHMNPVCLEGSKEENKTSSKSKSDQELESIDELFQIEIVKGETVYEGLDSDVEVRNHIMANHKEVINLIDIGEKDDEFEKYEI